MPNLPEIPLKSPKGTEGLSNSALNFLVNVCLMGQGASQVSELVHIIEHLTICCDVAFLVGLARAGLVYDFSFLGTDGETEVVTCPRQPVSTSLHCLPTGHIESTAVGKK